MYLLLEANNIDTRISVTAFPQKQALLTELESRFLKLVPDSADIKTLPSKLGWQQDGWHIQGEAFEASISGLGASISKGCDLFYWDVAELPFAFTTALYTVRSHRDYGNNECYDSVAVFSTREDAIANMTEDFEDVREEKLKEMDASEFTEDQCDAVGAALSYYEHEFRWEIEEHIVSEHLHGDAMQMYEALCQMHQCDANAFLTAQLMMTMHMEDPDYHADLLYRIAGKIQDAYNGADNPAFTLADLAEAMCHCGGESPLLSLDKLMEEEFRSYMYQAAENYRWRMSH